MRRNPAHASSPLWGELHIGLNCSLPKPAKTLLSTANYLANISMARVKLLNKRLCIFQNFGDKKITFERQPKLRVAELTCRYLAILAMS